MFSFNAGKGNEIKMSLKLASTKTIPGPHMVKWIGNLIKFEIFQCLYASRGCNITEGSRIDEVLSDQRSVLLSPSWCGPFLHNERKFHTHFMCHESCAAALCCCLIYARNLTGEGISHKTKCFTRQVKICHADAAPELKMLHDTYS